MKAPLLELLLKRDDLNLNKIDIWDNLLKWCFAQQNMTNDPTKWNKEDITKIERSLHRFIPLIRFYDIEPTDFFYKVYGYKDILPQDLIHDLLEFHIVPNIKPKTNAAPSRKPNLKFKLDSTIIESNHIPLFASWIDKKDSSHYNKRNIPYDFKLLYCSSRDGLDTKSFHKYCDNKGATIWVAKIQGSTQLIGGYNPLDWNGNGIWKNTTVLYLILQTEKIFLLQNWVMLIMQIMLFIAIITRDHIWAIYTIMLATIISGIMVRVATILTLVFQQVILQ